MIAGVPDIGQTAPDFKTLTAEGKTFQLSEVLKSSSNTVLIFYRGNW